MSSEPGEADDPFAVLDLPRQADLSADLIAERYREASRTVHPDAGGDAAPQSMEQLNAARKAVSDPAIRLRALLALEFADHPAGRSDGAIGGDLADLFAEVSGAVTEASRIAGARESARSALGRALLASDTVGVQKSLMAAGGKVSAAIQAAEARLPEVDRLRASNPAAARELADSLARNLAFLAKWQRNIQSAIGRLF